MYSKFFLFAGLLLLSCLTACQTSHTTTDAIAADLIFYNGTIYTVDSAFSIAEAIAIKNGRFLAAGSNTEIKEKFSAKESIDLQGKAVFPGFIDAHCHFYGYGKFKQSVDLTGAASFEEVIGKVKKFAEQNPEGWLLGRGWDQNLWKSKDFPTKDTLDKLFPDRPVMLTRIDGHAALANQKALNLAGITLKTQVNGGMAIKKDGKLTGVLIDNIVDSLKKAIPAPSQEEIKKYLLKAQEDCLKVGLTSVQDAGLEKTIIDAIDELQKASELHMRIYAMITPDDNTLDYYIMNGHYKNDFLNVRSIKLYADGALGSRGAALLEPYHDHQEHKGMLLMDSFYFRKLAKLAYDYDFQLNTHGIGDAGNRLILQTYALELEGKNDRRWRVEHAQVVNPQDFDMFSQYNIIPSVQPTHATSDMYWAGDRLGDERVKHAYAYKKLLEETGIIALGSDFPIESINPLYGFYAAVARQDAKQYPEEGFQIENALQREEALRGMTIWAAYAAFEENEKGSIEPGKFADFVILDRNIMEVPIREVFGAKILSTWIGGVKRF